MNKELRKVLSKSLSIELWEAAEKQATRSTLNNFRTGAVIFDSKTLEIKSKGCSHHRAWIDKPVVHAEENALYSYQGFNDSIVIVTLGKTDNFAYSSRPCLGCATKLKDKVMHIFYAERDNAGEWSVNVESPYELLKRAKYSGIRIANYAKDMRIP